jgi:hypothetical protein
LYLLSIPVVETHGKANSIAMYEFVMIHYTIETGYYLLLPPRGSRIQAGNKSLRVEHKACPAIEAPLNYDRSMKLLLIKFDVHIEPLAMTDTTEAYLIMPSHRYV